ncbi:MAG: hypothetical protein ABI317_04620, partial [Gaiellales bacterium]
TPFRSASREWLRFLPLTYLALALAYLVGNGKAYYLASLYPALLGLGALPVADWAARRRLNRGVLTAAVALSIAVSCYIALPLLPERSLQGSAAIKLNPDLGESVGWPRFLDTVARAWRSIPPSIRNDTAIFAKNYGEAGAIDVLGQRRALPSAFSGHNGFSEWQRPAKRDTHALLIGFDGPTDAAPQFDRCRRLAIVDNGVGLANNEQGLPVLLCHPTASWNALWPSLTHYD